MTAQSAAQEGSVPTEGRHRVNSAYAWYVLVVLTLVYLNNYLDRAILGILAEDVRHQLQVSDSQLGFLYGTAFGIFYALFGYPLGRLIDRCRRIPLLTGGMILWSLMTCWCGLTRTFGQLAVARVGVGIGEAIGNPAAYSLMSDWFTKEKRGTAMGLYASGMYIGSGVSLAIGGVIVVAWNHAYAGTVPPFGLSGWQVAFLAVGAPGLLLALWVSTLREPPRGMADKIAETKQENVFRRFLFDLSSVIPPFTLIAAARGGPRYLVSNIAAAALAAAVGYAAIQVTGDTLQWSALAVGCYAIFSSRQSLKVEDRPTFALTWGSPTFVWVTVGFACISTLNVSISFWVAPLALRQFAVDKATTGLILGAISAVAGLGGVLLGGRVSDMLIRKTPYGRIIVGIASALSPAPFLLIMCTTDSQTIYFLCDIPVIMLGNAWVPAGAATVQELVLPRMRGTATATYLVAMTVIGLGLGPYTVGKASMLFGSLSHGLLIVLAMIPLAAGFLLLAARTLIAMESRKVELASAAGEVFS